MKMKIADSQLLVKTMSAIGILANEGTFQIDADGFRLRAMDPSRVAMVDFSWPKTVFEEFVCDTPTKLCFHIGELLKLVKRASKNEPVELSTTDKGKLQISIAGKRNFTMPILESSEEEVPVPKITFNVKAKATADGLRNAVEDTQVVSDHVKILAEADKLGFTAQGDLMDADITLQKTSDTLLDLETQTPPQKATYSLSYLTEVLKAGAALADIVTVEFSTDMPIKLDFQTSKDGKLTYYLAPRIESE